jgi:hypothetical protein
VTDRELDASVAETLLNWDAVVQSHASDGPVPLRKMSVSRREAFLLEMRGIQAVAHAFVEAVRGGETPGDNLALKITEVDRRVFNQLVRPLLPEHHQLQNRGGLAHVTMVPQEALSPLPFAQIIELANLVLLALRGIRYEVARCANPRCDRGSYKRAKLFVREQGPKRMGKRFCSTACREAEKAAREEAALEEPEPPAPVRKRKSAGH